MLKVNAEVVNALALLLTGNVIQMFVGTVGSGDCLILYFSVSLLHWILCWRNPSCSSITSSSLWDYDFFVIFSMFVPKVMFSKFS